MSHKSKKTTKRKKGGKKAIKKKATKKHYTDPRGPRPPRNWDN
jgi:hypothetical protein